MADGDLTPIVAANLRRLRLKRGLSMERLSRVSGVSRAMLGQIELGQSTPTINLLWKVSRALNVPFSTLITDASAPSTTVMPRSGAGTTENLVVASGVLRIRVGKGCHRLGVGDAIFFEADVPHEYENLGDDEVVVYLVMTYAERVV